MRSLTCFSYTRTCIRTFRVTVSSLSKVLGHVQVAFGTGKTQRGLTTIVY